MYRILSLLTGMAFAAALSAADAEVGEAEGVPQVAESSAGEATETAAEPEINWETDYKAALARAQAEDRYILVNFSGSDWCFWCRVMEMKILKTKEFVSFANENFVCLLLDYPKRSEQSAELKEQNQKLLEQHNVRGFPTILLLNEKGSTVGRSGYRKGGQEAYIDHLTGIIGRNNLENRTKRRAQREAQAGGGG